MQFQRGQKSKLSDLTPSTQLEVALDLGVPPGVSIDLACFGLDAQGKLSDDRYFIFYNQKTSPCGALAVAGGAGAGSEVFRVDLGRLPPTIKKLVFVATIDGEGTMSKLGPSRLSLRAPAEVATYPFAGGEFGAEKAVMVAELYFKDLWRVAAVGQGFNGGLSAVLAHFGGQEVKPAAAPPAQPPAPAQPPHARTMEMQGLPPVPAQSPNPYLPPQGAPPAPPNPYGPPPPQGAFGAPPSQQPNPYGPPPPQGNPYGPPPQQQGANPFAQPNPYAPAGNPFGQPNPYAPQGAPPMGAPPTGNAGTSAPPAAPPAGPAKVSLDKRGASSAVNLKKGGGVQAVHINLNWNRPEAAKGIMGFLRGTPEAADLDLGCMYRMKDGMKGVIQPLGERFGSRTHPPYIFLDKDDRSGASSDGENLYILRPDLIDLVVVFAMIYEGTATFATVGARLTLKDEGGAEVFVPLNNPDPRNTFCAVASIRPEGGSIRVTKEERYFFGHKECDAQYGFGFRWVAGSK